MLKIGQNLPLIAKTAQHFVSVCASFKYFNCDTFLKLSIGALGEIDRSHTSTPERFDDGVGSDSFPYPVAFVLSKTCGCELREFFKGTGVVGEELFSFTEKCCVISTRPF